MIRRMVVSDIGKINSWLSKRGHPMLMIHDLPMLGFIIEDVCCGFLVKTDTSVAMIDFLISNPDALVSLRYNGIIAIVNKLIIRAKEDGFNKIRCDTNIKSVKNLALRLGFQCIESKYLFFKGI